MRTIFATVYIPRPILSLCCAAGSGNPDIMDKAWAQDLASKLISQLQAANDARIRIDWDKFQSGIQKNKDTLDRLPRYMYEDTVRRYRQGKQRNGLVDYVGEGIQEVPDSWKTPTEDVVVGDELESTGRSDYYQGSDLPEPDGMDVYSDEKNKRRFDDYGVGYKEIKPSYLNKTQGEIDADVKSRIRSLTIDDLHNIIIGSPGTKYMGQILLEFMNYPYPRSMRNKHLDYFYIKIVADASGLDDTYLDEFYTQFLEAYDEWVGPVGGERDGIKDPPCTPAEFIKNVKKQKFWKVISFHDGRNYLDKYIRESGSNDDPPKYRRPEDWGKPKGK